MIPHRMFRSSPNYSASLFASSDSAAVVASAGRKSHAAFLPVTPLAGSSAIACQSGLILYSKLMAPDKCFTSGLGDQREGATMSPTTRQLQPFIPPPAGTG